MVTRRRDAVNGCCLAAVHNDAARSSWPAPDAPRAAHPHADRIVPAGIEEGSVPGPSGELDIAGLSVQFGGLTALHDVSLAVPEHAVVGIIGPNGAGKTTLFNAVCGFVRPDAGTVRWRGAALGRVHPHRLVEMGIARTIQGVRLFPRLTALENVVIGADHLHRPGLAAALLGLPRSDRAERAARAAALEVLDELGVAGAAGSPAGDLPYGVQKRVALARALASRPSLLLLDEPAGGLGADDVEELAGLIRSLRDRMSVVLVEHRMDLVMTVCEHVVVLDAGRLIAAGAPAEVQADPAVLEAYLGSEAADAPG
jgi:branched-chain amino acid transport system ATP-binding protein